MTTSYICPECGHRVVLADGGGVWRTIMCRECNVEMQYDDDDANVEWCAHKDINGDYRIVSDGSEGS